MVAMVVIFAHIRCTQDHSKLFLPRTEDETAANAAQSSGSARDMSSKLSAHWLDVLAQPHLNGEQYLDSISHLRESLRFAVLNALSELGVTATSELALTDNECGAGDEEEVLAVQRTHMVVQQGWRAWAWRWASSRVCVRCSWWTPGSLLRIALCQHVGSRASPQT